MLFGLHLGVKSGAYLNYLNNTHTASAGARAYNVGLGAEPQRRSTRGRAAEVFVLNTVIFNGSAAVLHEMMYYYGRPM